MAGIKRITSPLSVDCNCRVGHEQRDVAPERTPRIGVDALGHRLDRRDGHFRNGNAYRIRRVVGDGKRVLQGGASYPCGEIVKCERVWACDPDGLRERLMEAVPVPVPARFVITRVVGADAENPTYWPVFRLWGFEQTHSPTK